MGASNDPEAYLESLIDEARAQRALLEGLVCQDAPESCDLCGQDMAQQRFLVDGEANGTPQTLVAPGRMMGQWSYMCAGCFAVRGVGIGWGTGQLYEQRFPGLWVMAAGFPPPQEGGGSDGPC